jgi:hypothetical protein
VGNQVLYPHMHNFPYRDLRMHMGIPVCKQAGIAKNFAYGDPFMHNEVVRTIWGVTYDMVVGCSLWGFGASNLQHHSGSDIPKSYPSPQEVYQCQGAPICPSTASQGAKTLFIHCIWNMDVGCSQWGFQSSTMTPQHQTGSAIPHFYSHLHM